MGYSEDYKAIVKAAVTDDAAFVRMTLSRRLRPDKTPWIRIVVRPVEIKGKRRMQFSFFDSKRDITKNYSLDDLSTRLNEVLAIPFGDIHIQSTTGDMRVRVDRKGIGHVSRSKPSLAEPTPDLSHDRPKKRLLPADPSDPFLREIGITNSQGKVRAAMQGKFRQIGEFLRTIEQTVARHPEPASADTEPTSRHPEPASCHPEQREGSRPLRMVDCGCGNAYLTFAAYHYLADKLGLAVELVGIDTNAELVERNRALAGKLGWRGIDFRVSKIADFELEAPPDVVLSLHACDTATDEAIAKGILWESRVILAAPCCQHELHDQLASPLWQPILRHGILRQRLADIVTDAFRALVLRIMGYRTEVIQFVDPEHTAKNLLIRAEKGLKPGHAASVREYRALKEFWSVTPAIEAMIGDGIRRFL